MTTDLQNDEQQLLTEIFPLGTKRDDRGVLLLGNTPVDQLIAKHGSPLYVFDEATIRAQCRSYTKPLNNLYPNSLTLYAAKAHIDPTIVGIAAAEGLGMDAVSSGEILVGLTGGMPAERIVMHGNNKLPSEIEYALDTGISRIVADSLDEIDLIADIAAHRETPANLILRITPGVEAHTHDYIRTGAVDSKFGLPLASGDAEIAIEKCLRAPWLKPIGLHSHIGSQIFELAPYADSVEILLDFAEDMHHKHGFVLGDFSPGGGFGIRYEESDDPPAAAAFVQTIAEAVNSRNRKPLPRLLIEPGRSIIARAGVALYSVGTIKTIPGVRTYVSVDGGIADNIRPALYEATYRALLANRETKDSPIRVTIAGRYCESGDVLLREIELPPLSRGDILAIPASGAYHMSMASNYNMVGRPATVLVCDGAATLTRQRETDEDLLRVFGAAPL